MIVRSVKGSTMPELLISLLITTIITGYCMFGMHTLYKQSFRSSTESAGKLRQLDILLRLHKDLSTCNNAQFQIGQLLIETPDDSVTYFFRNDTITFHRKQEIRSALFQDLNTSYEKAGENERGQLTIRYSGSQGTITRSFSVHASIKNIKDV